ncbi:replication initiation factor domain-containing protein [Isobaculum melis]|uniref:Phage replication initiation protein n=1 Tax=Isobaculum melis TaxID=142588 RepID=A0A1H9TNV9_9LACT|nr:replication initiation factor domain-containing protein [Isobaculum melis]SER99020.1 phage replication initiation protein [Isobaculum melis]
MSEANTPPTNRGVIGENEKDTNYLAALIDWCQITVQDVSPEMIANDILKIPFQLMKNDLRGGTRGYKALLCFDDIRVMEGVVNTENGYQILLTGQGCRNYEKFLIANNETWFDFFKRTLTYNVNFPRVDIAIDDRKTYFKISKLIQLSKAGLVVSKLRDGIEHGSFKLKDGQRKGQTIDFGSRKSQFFMTFYEKNYEQAEKLGLDETEIAEKWNRYELKFRQERAVRLVQELVARQEVFTIAMEILNENIRFVRKPNDSKLTDIKKYPLWQPWAWFMSDVKKLNLCMRPEAKNYFTMLNWIKVSVAPTLKILKIIDDVTGKNELDSLIDGAKFSEKHEKLLEDCLNQALAFEKMGIMI